MATAYDRGAAFERRTLGRFEREGYWCVRAASSRGSADFVALDLVGPDKRPLMVQCKRTARAMPPAEWNRLLELSRAARAIPLVAVALLKNDRVADTVVYRITGPKTGETARSGNTPWVVWDMVAKADRAVVRTVHAGMTPNWPPLAAPVQPSRTTGTDGGLTKAELAGIDQGQFRCARDSCHHGDAVHGPFCFVAGCECADWKSDRRIRPI